MTTYTSRTIPTTTYAGRISPGMFSHYQWGNTNITWASLHQQWQQVGEGMPSTIYTARTIPATTYTARIIP